MKRRMLYYSAFILIMGTVLIVLSGESQAQNVLTFEVRYENKLFINDIPLTACMLPPPLHSTTNNPSHNSRLYDFLPSE